MGRTGRFRLGSAMVAPSLAMAAIVAAGAIGWANTASRSTSAPGSSSGSGSNLAAGTTQYWGRGTPSLPAEAGDTPGTSAGSAPVLSTSPAPSTSARSSAIAPAVSAAATKVASTTPPVYRAPATSPVQHTVTRPAPSTAPPSTTTSSSLESAVFNLLNQERGQNGLPPLRWSAALTTSARRHSVAMADSGTLTHMAPGEADLRQREAAAGYSASAWAENVGETQQTGEAGALDLQRLLYSDPPHRANILSTSVRDIGVGIVVDSRGVLWLTEDFGG